MKEKGNSEQVNLDAIRKEDEELAEAEKQAEADNEQKNEELLRKLEKHKEEQKRLLQEQKQILEELKEHKKDIEQAAAKQRNEDNSPEGSLGKTQKDTRVKPEDESNEKNKLIDKNKQSPDVVIVKNIPSLQSGVSVVKMVENKSNVANDIHKPQNEAAQEKTKVEKKDPVPQPMKFESVQKITAGARPNHVNEIQQGPMNQMLQERQKKLASQNASNMEVGGSILQQNQGL
jgi:hypothetical protein